ncbi:DUF4153 domain-containing protein [Sphingomonas sp. CFBP8993]|uniref:DUF4153 domain-containing protein n=1 Tax=Sphingomonas sp. CFBP8993 TaxID=3096526 RepID=UPI002A6A0ABB|nr:DUF4153 domain-containing protein [Sphingomonas sp. CFBP8993]MDY0957128.1 DUF4153 domain-containing protein [Sphingomonas sp. CFBP8993]
MTVTTSRRFTFHAKLIGAAALIGLAHLFFYGEEPGWTRGGFALAWTIMLVLLRADVRASRAARGAVAVAVMFGLMLVDDPGPLKWLLFGVSIGMATLLPLRRFDDALQWAGRLFVHGIGSIAVPFCDAARIMRVRRRPGRSAVALAAMLVVPALGSALFLTLFAQANPLIEQAFAAIRFPDLSDMLARALFSLVFLVMVWSSLRPRRTLLPPGLVTWNSGAIVPQIGRATLVLSLVTFNLIFAVQNALDLAFLWSGAPLPRGVTLADYAHRGAYPLIVTALLAGGFVLLAGRSRDRLVRRLILLWIAQNLLLVASSILRTIDYIAAFSLSGWRIAALAWMGLVAFGLVLIVWRMLRGRSARWLVNANALAAGVVLTAGCASDLGAIAARWNVAHARSAKDIDLCYLDGLGTSALLPLIALERRAAGPILRDRTGYIIARIMSETRAQQANWHSWTWRNARRMAVAEKRIGLRPAPAPRLCGGEPWPVDPAEEQPKLTSGPRP